MGKFTDLLRAILREHSSGLTPQQIREIVKERAPEHYHSEANRRNVEKGHYSDLDHALLARVYVTSRNCSDIIADRSQKPMVLSLGVSVQIDEDLEQDPIETEDLEKLERGIGTLYIFGTNLFTKEGHEILKIGITTGSVEKRITQLFNTSVPFRFRIVQTYESERYSELEQSMHKMLDSFRINRSREFFTEQCLPFVGKMITLHEEILAARLADVDG